jgi:hypothetical protein
MMSKPVVRISVVLLVGIIILAGIFFTVQAASSTAGVRGGDRFLTAGLLPDQKHVRKSIPQIQPYTVPEGGYHEGGGCERDGVNPSDY